MTPLFDKIHAMQGTDEATDICSDDLNKRWLDVCSSDCYDKTFGSNFQNLKEAIDSYHQIPKTEVDRIPDRIKALKKISSMVADITRTTQKLDESTQNNLQRLAVRANLKAAYIALLPGLQEELRRRRKAIPLKPGSNVMSMGANMEVMKDLDPEKRYPQGLYEMWCKERDKNINTPPYFMWLETQDTREMIKDLRHFYLSLEKKKVKFSEDGHAFNEFIRSRNSPYVEDGRYLYNIGEDQELYILPEKMANRKMAQYSPTENSTFRINVHHDVVMGGVNILLAGGVEFKDGRIEVIDNQSGHYRSTPLRFQIILKDFNLKHPNAISDTTTVALAPYADAWPYGNYGDFKNDKNPIP